VCRLQLIDSTGTTHFIATALVEQRIGS